MRAILIFISLLVVGCIRRPLSDTECPYSSTKSATIEVSVDWSATGFELYGTDEYIHRVSFRFFPLDGSTPFDRYIEDDVESGTIEVPQGSYSVVVFNESIYDSYWSNAILFEDVDSYELFAAEIVDEDRTLYDFFYIPDEDELLSVELLNLASYGIAEFVVSETMVSGEWSDEDEVMASKLNPVVPQRLTCSTTIEVATENLSSANSVHASLTGLAHRVFMASGDADTITTTHIWQLSQREWEDEVEQHGTIYESRLTFSLPSTDESQHTLTLDFTLIDGSRHDPEEELIYDVSDQIVSSAAVTRYADNDLSASVSVSLPEVSGDVEVEDWGDDNEVTIQ